MTQGPRNDVEMKRKHKVSNSGTKHDKWKWNGMRKASLAAWGVQMGEPVEFKIRLPGTNVVKGHTRYVYEVCPPPHTHRHHDTQRDTCSGDRERGEPVQLHHRLQLRPDQHPQRSLHGAR